ncbi:MAG TPA: hypothetical protein VGK20_13140 [Candidatus Binatia bacterium]|jgi:glutaredoxin
MFKLLFHVILILGVLVAARPALATTLEDFGRCLAQEGATFYGASWCPHCRAQRTTLAEAMPFVQYVECSVAGPDAPQAAACTKANVETYPTWTFADGSQEDGEQSLTSLAAKTGCRLPAGAVTTAPTAKRWTSGPESSQPPATTESSRSWTFGPGSPARP